MSATGELYLWYSGSLRFPVGVYDRPADVLGLSSVQIPANKVTAGIRKATEFARFLEDSIPGVSDLWHVLPFD